MRDYDEYHEILDLWELGYSKRRISLLTGIPRATVTDCIQRYGSLKGLEENQERAFKSQPYKVLQRITDTHDMQIQQAYAYLLGIYLGDGSISRNRKIFRLRVTLDEKYPHIIESCVRAIQTLLPDNEIGVIHKRGCVDVSCYHKFWPILLPQHGAGRKHKREIKLEDWQQAIIETYPLELFRGLYHSDGSRFSNIVNDKDYPRYQFTNTSEDICCLFCETCDRLELHWTLKQRRSPAGGSITDIFISNRKDVDFLDRLIGPKQ